MPEMRTRRLMIWVVLVAACFPLADQIKALLEILDQSEEGFQRRKQRQLHRRLAAVHAAKAAEYRRLEQEAISLGQMDRAARMRKGAEGYEWWARVHGDRQ